MIDVKIMRKKDPISESFLQIFSYEGDIDITVEQLLIKLNKQICMQTNERPITWECSCEQGICGGCAMVINNIPRLACQTYCSELLKIDSSITIVPLSKFPVICDLKVDRSAIKDMMLGMDLWLKDDAVSKEETYQTRYEASNCLMCGCCLEACPNYSIDRNFSGMLGTVSISNLELQSKKDTFKKQYIDSVFEGCSKSLACQNVCPLNIPMLEMTSVMNRRSVWKVWNIFKKNM